MCLETKAKTHKGQIDRRVHPQVDIARMDLNRSRGNELATNSKMRIEYRGYMPMNACDLHVGLHAFPSIADGSWQVLAVARFRGESADWKLKRSSPFGNRRRKSLIFLSGL